MLVIMESFTPKLEKPIGNLNICNLSKDIPDADGIKSLKFLSFLN